MRLGELPGVQRWLPDHPLASDRLWSRESSAVSEGEIQLFYARAGLQGMRREAIDAIDTLQAAIITAAFSGTIKDPPRAVILHEPPLEPYFVDDLVSSLVKLTPPRRRACLFALDRRSDLEEVAALDWQGAKTMTQLNPACQEILAHAGKTRHMKLPYVFWEWATPTIAAPLLELEWSVSSAFECTWPELQRRYERMVKVHRGADAAHLLRLTGLQHG